MNATLSLATFEDIDIARSLSSLTDGAMDELNFGVIGFDAAGIVRIYNRCESAEAGLSAARVLGRSLFTEVAPCMNNFMVAQRFEDARRSGHSLDATIDYVLTLRMRPTRVALRLVCEPGVQHAYVLVRRLASA